MKSTRAASGCLPRPHAVPYRMVNLFLVGADVGADAGAGVDVDVVQGRGRPPEGRWERLLREARVGGDGHRGVARGPAEARGHHRGARHDIAVLLPKDKTLSASRRANSREEQKNKNKNNRTDEHEHLSAARRQQRLTYPDNPRLMSTCPSAPQTRFSSVLNAYSL